MWNWFVRPVLPIVSSTGRAHDLSGTPGHSVLPSGTTQDTSQLVRLDLVSFVVFVELCILLDAVFVAAKSLWDLLKLTSRGAVDKRIKEELGVRYAEREKEENEVTRRKNGEYYAPSLSETRAL